MKLKYLYLFIRILLFLKCFFVKVYSYDIAIKSDIENMDKLYLVYDEISKSMKYREIRIVLDDEEYFVEPRGRNHFNIYYTLIFYTEKGSILNYGSTYTSSFRFHFLPESDIKKLYFKNLTFRDFDGHAWLTHLIYLSVDTDKNDFYVEFDNCTFINITGYLLHMEVTFKQFQYETPQVLFKNCTFT